MSDVIEFAKILRRIAKGSVWQEAFGSRSIEAWMLDAAIAEYESRGREVVITGPTDEQRGEYPPGVGPGEFGTAGEMPRYPKWAKPPRDGIFAPREDVAIGRWLAGETPASISTDYDESENWFWHVVRQALWRYRRDEKSRDRNQVCDADERLGTQAGETPAPSPSLDDIRAELGSDRFCNLLEIEMERLNKIRGDLEIEAERLEEELGYWKREVELLKKACGLRAAEVELLNRERKRWIIEWGKERDRANALEAQMRVRAGGE